MNFSQVDPVLQAWARANSLPILSHYQDAEVRSFEIVGRHGRVQMWVEVNGQISVYVWDFQKRKELFITGLSGLEASLDQAVRLARTWCEG